jgi:hypothetical protein
LHFARSCCLADADESLGKRRFSLSNGKRNCRSAITIVV